jgi:hypothetical protein
MAISEANNEINCLRIISETNISLRRGRFGGTRM